MLRVEAWENDYNSQVEGRTTVGDQRGFHEEEVFKLIKDNDGKTAGEKLLIKAK